MITKSCKMSSEHPEKSQAPRRFVAGSTNENVRLDERWTQ